MDTILKNTESQQITPPVITREQLDLAGAVARGRLHSLIRSTLARHGIRQQQLASMIGVNKSTISRMLSSPKNLTVENAGRILRALNCWLELRAEPINIQAQFSFDRTSSNGLEYRLIVDPNQPNPVLILPQVGSRGAFIDSQMSETYTRSISGYKTFTRRLDVDAKSAFTLTAVVKNVRVS